MLRVSRWTARVCHGAYDRGPLFARELHGRVTTRPEERVDSRARRLALRNFLVECRSRLRPEDVGLNSGGRRRVPGLRREEVAELAGVSALWYALLETPRDIRVSPQMLDRLATSLRLSDEEKLYLFSLAIHELPIIPRATPDSIGAIGREYFELQRFIRRSRSASNLHELADLTTDSLFNLAQGVQDAYFVKANLSAKQFTFVSQRTAPRFDPVIAESVDFASVHDAQAVLIRGELFAEPNVATTPHAIFRERAASLGSGRFISAGIKSLTFDGAVGYFDLGDGQYAEREKARLSLVAEIVAADLDN
jgi:transcriptional regulator with XRE-family HTH domain